VLTNNITSILEIIVRNYLITLYVSDSKWRHHTHMSYCYKRK